MPSEIKPSYRAMDDAGLLDADVQEVARFCDPLRSARVACGCRVPNPFLHASELPKDEPVEITEIVLQRVTDGPVDWMMGQCPHCKRGFYSGPYWLDDRG